MSSSTFSPSLPIPPPTSLPCHLHLSTGRHPIIHTPTLQMPKPPLSATPHHICHTLYTQKTLQIHTALSIFQRHSAHPSHHHFDPSSPGYADSQPSSPMFQSHMSNPLWTQALYIFLFMWYDAPHSARIGENSLNLAEAHLLLALAASSTPPPAHTPLTSPRLILEEQGR